MKDSGGRLVDVVGLAECVILINQWLKRAALNQRENFRHFRSGEDGGDGAVHIAVLFPLFLILEKRLFHGLNLADLRGGTSIARGYTRVRVHGEREIAMDQVDLAAADVVLHQPAIRGGEKRLASRALKVAENLHSHGSVLRAEGLVRIDVGEVSR